MGALSPRGAARLAGRGPGAPGAPSFRCTVTHARVTELETDIRRWVKTADEILEPLDAYCRRITYSGYCVVHLDFWKLILIPLKCRSCCAVPPAPGPVNRARSTPCLFGFTPVSYKNG